MGDNTLYPLKYIAYISALITILGIMTELMRVVAEAQRLIARQEAFQRQQLTEFDFRYLPCLLYFVPATDLPNHIAGVVFKPMMHVINVFLLVMVVAEEYPRKVITEKLQVWCLPFSIQCSCWYAGAVQTLVGIGQVGTPTGVVNNDSIALFRLIAGFMLLFIGIVNVVIGMASSYDIRWFRDQYAKPEEEDWDRRTRMRDKWLLWRALIATVYAEHLAVGSLRDGIAAVDDLVYEVMYM